MFLYEDPVVGCRLFVEMWRTPKTQPRRLRQGKKLWGVILITDRAESHMPGLAFDSALEAGDRLGRYARKKDIVAPSETWENCKNSVFAGWPAATGVSPGVSV